MSISKVTGVFILPLICGCLVMDNPYSKLPPGPWRGVLKLDLDRALAEGIARETKVREMVEFEEVTEGQLPFNFEVKYIGEDSFYLEIRNGGERIKLDDISFSHDQATNKDTVIIRFPAYDSYLEAIFEDKVLEGRWVVPSRGTNYVIPFVAHHGQDHRFTTLQKPPITDVTGRWECQFEIETEEPYPAIGLFKQEGNHLTGTFQTETGDYRYLEGSVQADKLYLSCFDGAHMFLFEGKIHPDNTITGIFRSGSHYLTSWSAVRNEDFALAHPDSLTYVKTKDEPFAFTFPDANGNLVSLTDPEYQGRPKIIQILGTWCPNCLDETEFLVEWLDEHPDLDIAVIGLAFERYDDPSKARKVISRYREKLGITYPILHAGKSNKREASKQLPMLNEIISYPTLIFLDRNNQVHRIHTGFNGPATPDYSLFVEEFEETIHQLLDQPGI